MDYSKMSISELKEYAKSIGVSVGNSGKDKLIEKIKEKEAIASVMSDDDLESAVQEEALHEEDKPKDTGSLIDLISNAIDEMDESVEDDMIPDDIDLALNDTIPVKSITFGGLTYKSRSTNAIYRWNQIGAVEYMTVAELNEMNNYKRSYLNNPLVILMDERAVKKFRLQKIYENIAQINNLKNIFKSDTNTISRVIDTAIDTGMRDMLISKVRQMIKNGTLVNVSVIKLLERKLKYDFMNAIE